MLFAPPRLHKNQSLSREMYAPYYIITVALQVDLSFVIENLDSVIVYPLGIIFGLPFNIRESTLFLQVVYFAYEEPVLPCLGHRPCPLVVITSYNIIHVLR